MKLALITPIPDLTRFATLSRVHLVLPEHMEDEQYLSFYKYRRSVGDFLILDNGAHEHARPLPISELMMRASELSPNEIVLPDVQRDCEETINATCAALAWLTTNVDMWHALGRPRLHVVPQGTTMDEWARCRDAIVHSAKAFLGSQRTPTIGIAKHHEDLITGGISRLVASTIGHPEFGAYAIHLLGWPRRLLAVKEIYQMFPQVRSVDTARPFTFAKVGREIWNPPHIQSLRYPSRGIDYFTEPIPVESRELAEKNINDFMWFAGESGRPSAYGIA